MHACIRSARAGKLDPAAQERLESPPELSRDRPDARLRLLGESAVCAARVGNAQHDGAFSGFLLVECHQHSPLPMRPFRPVRAPSPYPMQDMITTNAITAIPTASAARLRPSSGKGRGPRRAELSYKRASMDSATRSARLKSPTTTGVSTDAHARTRLITPASSNATPRAV